MINAMSTSENKPTVVNQAEETIQRGRPPGSRAVKSRAVEEVRQKLGWTQEELARSLNCSLSAVRRYEREEVLPSTGAIKVSFLALAQRAGVTIEGIV